jgi:hypothetical protein
MTLDRHQNVINKILELWSKAGNGSLQFGLDDSHHYKNVEMFFDYGSPHYVYTKHGRYFAVGMVNISDTNLFMELIQKTFNVKVLSEQRKTPCSGVDFQRPSGGLIRLNEKVESFKWS